MSLQTLPYCGTPPLPGELLARFNLDPLLLLVLATLTIFHVSIVSSANRRRALTGWLIASAAFVSPLCALSVALFSARVAQHMLLILLAAPLIASAWPTKTRGRGVGPAWSAGGAFLPILWFWHMPAPYDSTFTSTVTYWLMHVSLFGSAMLLWRELLHHSSRRTVDVLVIGALSSMQMGLLGAILTFAGHPMFIVHVATTTPWGLSTLRDQQLGGVLMWVPGIALFLFAALRSLGRLWTTLESEKAT